jgi:transcriptional regulator GlxA family with amidase domain
MMKNFRNEIKLEQVASIANMSPTSFCRYFKSRTNKTVIQFLNEIRIGHAHKMLIETQYNMDQISSESGYKNVSNFYEQFQKITGKSPFKFRKEHNESRLGFL